MCFKAECGFKTHGATVRKGINTDGERDCSQQSGQQLAAGVHVTAVWASWTVKESSDESQQVTWVEWRKSVSDRSRNESRRAINSPWALSNSIYLYTCEFHVTGMCTMRKWHLTLKWRPEVSIFAYLLSERYEDSFCQGSCALKNETILCENQGDRLCHFWGRPF